MCRTSSETTLLVFPRGGSFVSFRTRDSDRERSERLDAAYEEMMNDNDFDEMVIDNQTTMHVNKTPVSSAYSKTRTDSTKSTKSRTDLSSKSSSTVDNDRGRSISDTVNRGTERVIGAGGDNGRGGGDISTSRVESPVPGTSKGDVESPVIPVVQAGAKVSFHSLYICDSLVIFNQECPLGPGNIGDMDFSLYSGSDQTDARLYRLIAKKQ